MEERKKQRYRVSRPLIVALIVGAVLASGVLGFLLSRWTGPRSGNRTGPEVETASGRELPELPAAEVEGAPHRGEIDSEASFRLVEEKVRPAVVGIEAGSGVIVGSTGRTAYVLTNRHLLPAGGQTTVRLWDTRRFTTRIVGEDFARDLALLAFTLAAPVPVATLGDSDAVQPGDRVFAVGVGNASTAASVPAVGVVDAVIRSVRVGAGSVQFTDYIRTDATIDRVSSGGALANHRGEVIGINVFSPDVAVIPRGGQAGPGYAIPINAARRDVREFLTTGQLDFGWLGVEAGGLSPLDAEDLKLPGVGGAFVFGVFRDSPADRAGILPGDYITALAGEKVEDSTGLLLLMADLERGDRVQCRLIRSGQNRNVEVQLSARRREQAGQRQTERPGVLWPGFSVTRIPERIRRQLNLKKAQGNLIVGRVAPGTPGAAAGLRSGDLIVAINGTALATVADFYRELNTQGGRPLHLTVGHREAVLTAILQP